jgi:hypothetical protein
MERRRKIPQARIIHNEVQQSARADFACDFLQAETAFISWNSLSSSAGQSKSCSSPMLPTDENSKNSDTEVTKQEASSVCGLQQSSYHSLIHKGQQGTCFLIHEQSTSVSGHHSSNHSWALGDVPTAERATQDPLLEKSPITSVDHADTPQQHGELVDKAWLWLHMKLVHGCRKKCPGEKSHT